MVRKNFGYANTFAPKTKAFATLHQTFCRAFQKLATFKPLILAY